MPTGKQMERETATGGGYRTNYPVKGLLLDTNSASGQEHRRLDGFCQWSTQGSDPIRIVSSSMCHYHVLRN